MEKIRLGRTGLMVSRLGFGGIPIIPLDEDESVDIVRHAYYRGINFFDTAHAYQNSEAKIGKALEGMRGGVVLATKSTKRDAAGLAVELETSFTALRTDYIDIFQFHNVSKQADIEKIMAPGGGWEAASRARDEGRIGFIGFSSHNADFAAELCASGRFDTVQIPFNFIERDPLRKLAAAAAKMDMGMIGMKPLGGGVLDNAELCFGFLREHPEFRPIPGFAAKAEIDQAIEYYLGQGKELGEAARAEMKKIQGELGGKFCHRCGYCLPCTEGIPIPQVMNVPAMLRRFGKENLPPRMGDLMRATEKCSECGECMTRCPYELPIPELMTEYRMRFDAFMNA